MGSSNLTGPFRLSYEGIDVAVRKEMPGVFALGSMDNAGRFCLSKVGRSDVNVKEALRMFIASESLFKFSYEAGAERAFFKECELFHKFRPQGNMLHPSRPAGTALTCPHCQADHRDR